LGRYCPEGSAAGIGCPAGTFSDTRGLTLATDCPQCDPGWYCPTIGLITPYGECEAGHYCKLGALASNPDGESWGYLCPVGHYCPQGTATPVACDLGTYNALEGM